MYEDVKEFLENVFGATKITKEESEELGVPEEETVINENTIKELGK